MHFEAPTALQYFAALVADDTSFPMIEVAVAVAQEDDPAFDVLGVLAQIDALADRLKRRIPGDAPPLQRLRLVNQYFFQELGFGGNVNDYYDHRNSYLPSVLSTRRGIPITLALLYMEVAAQVGLKASGISFPGHFLVKLHLPRGEVIIDPFTGHSLSREQLDERLLPYRQQRGLVGDFEAPLGLFLQAAPPREVIARLLRNLKEIHRSAGDWTRLLSVTERLVILLPSAWEERRDRGLALAALGRPQEAADDLATYLGHCPDAEDAGVMRQQIVALRRYAPSQPRLH